MADVLLRNPGPHAALMVGFAAEFAADFPDRKPGLRNGVVFVRPDGTPFAVWRTATAIVVRRLMPPPAPVAP